MKVIYMYNLINNIKIFNKDSLTHDAISILPAYYYYHKQYRLLKKTRRWSTEELSEYQLAAFKKLLAHSYEHVPYYRHMFDSLRLKPEDIRDISDIDRLPFLTREDIRKNIDHLKTTDLPSRKFEYVTTGGSMGIPLGLFYEKGVSRAIEWAFMKTQWDRVGYHFTDKCVVMRGNTVKSADPDTFWEYELLGRWMVLSSYHMNYDTLPKYVEMIKKFKPKYIQAFPSVITILAKYMQENNLGPFPTLKAILCGSENLYPVQKALLENTFRCRVYSWYGHTEQAVLAGECECSSYYHIFPEYGITELIGTDDKPVTGEGEIGEIVATGLNNYAMPLIRYRTGDLGVYTKERCACGRNYPLLKRIEGRLQDIVLIKDGSLVSLTALIFAQHFNAFLHIKEMQLVQEEPGKITVKIVKSDLYTASDEAEIFDKMETATNNMLDISFEYTEKIPRTDLGKYRFLIQKIPIDHHTYMQGEGVHG